MLLQLRHLGVPTLLWCKRVDMGSMKGWPLLSLLSSVLRIMSSHEATSTHPLVVAAGGLALCSQIAAVLALGADGVLIGTRFLATPEDIYLPNQKKAIIESKGAGATGRTMIFDRLDGPNFWERYNLDGRALINETFKEAESGRSDEAIIGDYKDAALRQDTSRIATWAGSSAGLVNEMKPAGEVVKELWTESLKAIQMLSTRVTV